MAESLSGTATTTVLTLPELLTRVLEHLDAPTLARAVRVNRQWFACGTDVLWREPPVANLLALGSESRQQIYAPKIRKLDFTPLDNCDGNQLHSSLKHLSFRSLRIVSIDMYRLAKGCSYDILQYIQPRLEELVIFGGELDDDLLRHIRATCPRLRRILLDAPGKAVTPLGFYDFIVGCRALEKMEFLYGMDHLLTDRLLSHLASRETLTRLGLGRPLSKDFLEHISDNVPQPFAALKSLQLRQPISSSAVPWLSRELSHLRTLDFAVRDADASILPYISSMSKLRSLTLILATPSELSSQEIMSLGALSRLAKLFIGPDGQGGESGPRVTEQGSFDSVFDELCSKLASLKVLEFNVQCDLSAQALRSLSNHCPLLEELKLPQAIDIRELNLEAVDEAMFPNLIHLGLDGLFGPVVENVPAAE
ncbi:hypothetical protein JDV02_002856 [Purpureocillium takamizusanense]|nr:uncharacterized protein JDV02_002856 [Purpureocillium takamizusanense]UNI16424.1 hypothetical protein JDV02_002856 [Purpureocillium takamizusanense]